MPEINTRTLVMCIQAVAAEIRALQADAHDPEVQQLIDHYERAAADLEDAYDEAAKTVLNLPPYDDLVGGGI